MSTIVALLVIAGVAYRVIDPIERAHIRRHIVSLLRYTGRLMLQELRFLWSAIRQPPAAFVTPAIVAANLAVFLGMLFGHGSMSDPATLLAWGASAGPVTSNGQWWRLATAPIVHAGFITLMVNAIAIAEIGVVVERRVGGFALAAAYASAALLANVVNLWTSPLAMTSGASAGVCGLYGLLVAIIVTAARTHAADGAVLIGTVRRLIPMTAGVLIVNVLDTNVGATAELAGFAAGVVFGLAIVRDVPAVVPSRRVGAVVAGAVAVAMAAAAPLHGILDIAPEIRRLVEIEKETAKAYEAAYGRFKKNSIDVDALALVIDRTIVPALQQADDRVKSLTGIPREETWRIADAREYLRLRMESWSLRARGLRETHAPVTSGSARSTRPATTAATTMSSAEAAARYRVSLMMLGKADASERVALQVLDRIKV